LFAIGIDLRSQKEDHGAERAFETFVTKGGLLHPGVSFGRRVAAFEELWDLTKKSALLEFMERTSHELKKIAPLAFTLERIAAHPSKRPACGEEYIIPVDEKGKMKVDLLAVAHLRRSNLMGEVKAAAIALCQENESVGYFLSQAMSESRVGDTKESAYPVTQSVRTLMIDIVKELDQPSAEQFLRGYIHDQSQWGDRVPENHYLRVAYKKAHCPNPKRGKAITKNAAPV
jgi:hypothetical protein